MTNIITPPKTCSLESAATPTPKRPSRHDHERLLHGVLSRGLNGYSWLCATYASLSDRVRYDKNTGRIAHVRLFEGSALPSRRSSGESLHVRLADDEIAWIEEIAERAGISASHVIETALDAYLLVVAACQTIRAPVLSELSAKPARHYLVSSQCRQRLKSVSAQGRWSQNTLVRLALAWFKELLPRDADGSAPETLAATGIRLDKNF